MTRQRGAALLIMFAVLFAIAAAAAVAALRPMLQRQALDAGQQRSLALARDALRGAAFRQHCANPAQPIDVVLACPESGGVEGDAAASCPGATSGWLPWRALGVPPLRDAAGTCLWMERNGPTARVIAAGAPRPGQLRTADPARVVCPGNNDPAQYLDAADAALVLTLDAAALTAACP